MLAEIAICMILCNWIVKGYKSSTHFTSRTAFSACLKLQGMKRSSHDSSLSESQHSKRLKLSNEVDTDLPFLPLGFQVSRARLLTKNKSIPDASACVVLWMQRDQRVFDNNALYYAQSVALSRNIPLRVIFNLVPRFLEATLRQYDFMINGLKEVETQLRELQIPFHLLMGDPLETVPRFVRENNAAVLVSDFSPLRISLGWVQSVANELDRNVNIPFVQVDAHNIVPCWAASPKLEYSARTFRGKILPKFSEYLRDVPRPVANPCGSCDVDQVDWVAAMNRLEINREIGAVSWIRPGSAAAEEMLNDFIENRLDNYADDRNDPNKAAASNLSPYIHFGHISVGKIILTLRQMKKGGSSVDSFIEEAVVRRELTDNFCFCKCEQCFSVCDVVSNFYYFLGYRQPTI